VSHIFKAWITLLPYTRTINQANWPTLQGGAWRITQLSILREGVDITAMGKDSKTPFKPPGTLPSVHYLDTSTHNLNFSFFENLSSDFFFIFF